MNAIWKLLASLRLTVVLLVLATVLVFLGTLAQVHEGLYDAQVRWFKSFVVTRRAGDVWWVPPVFPGGYTLGFALLFNLLAAHLQRFKLEWSKAGIHLTHGGILLLLAGQLATDLLARESFLHFVEGESKNYSQAHREFEVAVLFPDAGGKQGERFITFDSAALTAAKAIEHPDIPFRISPVSGTYRPNANIVTPDAAKQAVETGLTAMARLETDYGTPEGIRKKAEEALTFPARIGVWKVALRAAGAKSTEDIVAAASDMAAKPETEALLRKNLQTSFRKQMLMGFRRRVQMLSPEEEDQVEVAIAMRWLADELEAGRQPDLTQMKPLASQGAGAKYLALERAEGRGMDDRNLPMACVEIFAKKGGASLGTWLLSPDLRPQEIEVEGVKYKVALRPQTFFYPFSLTLLKTTHEIYPGTDIPKNFQSRVRIENNATQERREVDIFMNNPLRYGGVTFYQHQMGKVSPNGGKGTSQLQVVQNPSWITPYLGCLVVSVGMVWQFLEHLVKFVRRMSKRAATQS
jgi:hypothetical protein